MIQQAWQSDSIDAIWTGLLWVKIYPRPSHSNSSTISISLAANMYRIPPSHPISKSRNPRPITLSSLFPPGPIQVEYHLCRKTRKPLTKLSALHLLEIEAKDAGEVGLEDEEGKAEEFFEEWLVPQLICGVEE